MSEELRSAKFAIGDAVTVNGKTGKITKLGLFPTVEDADGKVLPSAHISKLKAAAEARSAEGPDENDAFEEGDDVIIISTGRTGVISDILGDGEYVVDDDNGDELGTFDESALRLGSAAADPPVEEQKPSVKERLKTAIQNLIASVRGVPDEPATIEAETQAEAEFTALADTPGEEAAEEAAELVEYQTIRTLLDQAAATLGQAQMVVSDLTSDEEDDPTETPEEEDAETEVEAARLRAILSLVTATINSLYAVTSTVQSCISADMQDAMDDESGDGEAVNVLPRYSAEGQLILPTAEERAALGARHSSHDMRILQSVHDNSVALGAECPSSALRDAAEAEEVERQRLAEEDSSRSAGAAPQGEESDMTREDRIATLIAASAGTAEPYTEADRPWLLTLSNSRFSALEAVDKIPVTAEEFLDSAPDEIRDLVAKGRAAVAPLVPKTEEEYLQDAPESIRTLVAEKKAADAALKTELIKTLSSNQKEFGEPELQKMNVNELGRLVRALRLDEPPAVDFSALGISRAAAAGAEDVYANPPDGYALAVEKRANRVQ